MSDVLDRAANVGLDVVELAQELIRRPSLTPDDAGCQSLIAEQLRPFDFAIEQIDFNDVLNMWAVRGEAAPLLVFVGHTDVVPPGPTSEWDSMPFAPTVRNNCIYGRGAADMKGGIAAFIAALSQFVSEHPSHRGSVGVLVTSDEEGKGTDGVVRVVNEYLKDRHKVDYCLVGEPISQEWAGDTIKNGARGVLIGRLTVEGVVEPHLLEMLGDHASAVKHYRTAAGRTTSIPERNYLIAQAARLEEGSRGPDEEKTFRHQAQLRLRVASHLRRDSRSASSS